MRARSLLVVDPNPSTHDFLTGVLQHEGRTIRDAYNRREALDLLRAGPYDLVVAGPGRNGLDGLKLIRHVRALQPEARVILTGEPDPARVIGAIRARAYSYFHHPLTDGPLAEMVQQALDAVTWQDDIQVLSATPEWITLEVRCKLNAADRAIQFLREVEADLPAHHREDIASAARELLLNAIEHGGKSDPHKRVRITIMRTSHARIVQIHDPGKGFSLDSLPHAAISNPEGSPIQHVEVRAETGQRPGGFGILMTRSLVDDLIYNQRGNTVMFVKYIGGKEQK